MMAASTRGEDVAVRPGRGRRSGVAALACRAALLSAWGACLAGSAALGSVALGAEGGPLVLEEPMIEIPLEGIDPERIDVMIGDALGTGFVVFEEGKATVLVPFPDSFEPFAVTFIDRETGETLFDQSYRMSSAGKFDRLEGEIYGQLDTYGKFFQRLTPEPADPVTYERHSLAADSVLGLETEAAIDGFTFRGRAEGVHTTEPIKRFRSEGGAADVSDFLAELDYEGDYFTAHTEDGDASVPGNNPLVNRGIHSRGGAFRVGFLDDRVSFHGGMTYGEDIAGAEHLNVFEDEDSNRLAGGVDIDLWRGDYVNLTWRGSFYNAERRDDNGFHVGEVSVGERNRILGSGATLGLLNDRITISSDFAWSEYANPSDLDFGVTDFTTSEIVEVGNENGNAERHRLDVRIWDGETLQIDGYAQYEEVEPFYRALEVYVPPDRKTTRFGGSLFYDPVSISVDHEAFDTNIEDIPGVLSTYETTDIASIQLDLEQFRGGFGNGLDEEENGGCDLCLAIPSRVGFEAQQWRIKGTNGHELVLIPGLFFTEDLIPKERTETYSFDIGWDFGDVSTDFAVLRAYQNDQSVGNNDADSRETGVEASASYYGSIWDASAGVYVAVVDNLQIDNKLTDTEYTFDGSFGLRLEDLPNLSAHGEVTLFRTKADLDERDSRELTYRASATLDFTKFLPEVLPGLDSYLTSTFLYQYATNKDAFFGKTHEFDASWTVSWGVEF